MQAGEYGFLPPGMWASSIAASGKIYSFEVLQEDTRTQLVKKSQDVTDPKQSVAVVDDESPEPKHIPNVSLGALYEGNPTVRHDGVTLSQIEAGGPCDQAGLQPGDVLLALDGHFLFTANEVVKEVHRHRPSERISIRFRRNSIIYDTYVALAAKPTSSTATASTSEIVSQF